MSTDEPSPIIACNLAAFDPRQRKRHRTLQAQLQRALIGAEETPKGYRFRYPGSRSWVLRVAEFITLERLCCPFFSFTLEVNANELEQQLTISGSPEAKAVLTAQLLP